ncbi:aspartyl-phosphate phosphatase Spo0E family protein [Bacillus sp. FJAT-49736]|uniref:aspartyl-phosphate phosphatase Spo0E family protein n=1 Tax=Bacillus sp. FJAT-49736 TaxID=2833582 RepID=UPI001BC940BE|nr:aspartyl-phosphate phosphatase Spo0E family protein [Bacillus sp. FJAT-49736]MBS4172627.1 aspartyl-phosphate phosphatase Spo0E family protein [Bacillus sp. FJAT-49736]
MLIEKKRAQLIEIVMNEGLHSPNTIFYSQELDTLLNKYNQNYINRKTTTSVLTTN